ncbi:MAG: hypothetical protein A2176_05540 [Spirochaetes bacterium RBG_13_51_14]|nr:MAG: hypothetical protein A2176_05540 [Spirochaetes bacterium RBG_13_51_14]
MKKIGLFILTAAFVFSLSASDVSAAGLVLNGSGVRTKFLVGTLYTLSLYVSDQLKGKSGKEVIESNDAMYFVMQLESNLITRERFVESTGEGFGKSAASGYATAKKQAFLDQFNKTVFNKGDIIIMSYTPAGLTTTYKKVETGKDGKPAYMAVNLGTIAGLDLKKALFAIWLGPDPIQDSLKNALLGVKK